MLEDIGKIPPVKKTLERAVIIIGFLWIYKEERVGEALSNSICNKFSYFATSIQAKA
jgi:hypothetical protein